ncbi:MAG: chemotaxis protein CheW [Comamonas sp. SCN 67-35]|uniref:chemotaxis protein CheW n=1 Tax=unclassified Comamonas TaxID=2638500 RepID=UPI00086DF1BE|nr:MULTISPECIES: chemotaxis protein CheW [unclassified Comamonas]MBN9330303.1 chemotaxis protein CheW [Comamonas sp.]ODU37878.1 MAG: chemotaxis protein CheW [Comamonas sp. SCN 67-35]OJW98715.1 MAG: chemotaxis protein CheW [Burkholderiales bacterium 66-26]
MSTITMEHPREVAAVQEISEFLTFRLGKEEYGIDILQVQEIRSYEEPTRMVGTPEFIKGVINLRGTIVPIIDLRIKLGCDRVEYDDFTVVIFLNIANTTVGVVVDAVADVAQLTREQIKSAPHFEGQLDAAFVRGIASVGQRMLILIDMQALLSASELKVVEAVGATTA